MSHPSGLYVTDDYVLTHNTSLALSHAVAAAEAGHQVAVMSLEMSRVQLGLRLLGALARIDAMALRTGRLTKVDWWRLSDAVAKLEGLPVTMNDAGDLSLPELRTMARELKLKQGLDLLIVDYLQLMRAAEPGESRQQEVSEISRGLKQLAKELQIPVIALSQLSRACEAREDKRPVLADLRESGALEQDADLVLFLYRDEVYDPDSPDKGIAELLIRKHRNGPTTELRLTFLDRYATFVPYSPRMAPGEPILGSAGPEASG